MQYICNKCMYADTLAHLYMHGINICVYNVNVTYMAFLSHLSWCSSSKFSSKAWSSWNLIHIWGCFQKYLHITYRIYQMLPEMRRKLCTQATINIPGVLIYSPNNVHKGWKKVHYPQENKYFFAFCSISIQTNILRKQ